MKKSTRKVSAALIAAAMTCGMVQVMPASATPALADPPGWKPTDAQSAVDFLNEYGSTYVSEDGYVAFCFPVRPDEDNGGGIAALQECTADYNLVLNTTLRYSCPYEFSEEEEPDYDQYPGKERYEVERAYREWLAAHHQGYQFYLWHIESEGTFSFKLQRDNQSSDTGHVYSFSRSAAGVVTETDIYGWMPDCRTEFENYLHENGGISCHDNYVICAGVVNYSTGAEMNIETSGDGEISEFGYSGCTGIILGEQPTGNASYVFRYAEATKPGELNVSMEINIPWAPEEAKEPVERMRFVIGDDMMVHYYQEPYIIPHEIPEWTPGCYDEALEFSDTYGKTLIKDGYICMCFPYRKYRDEEFLLLNNFQTGKLDPETVQQASLSAPLMDMQFGKPTTVDCDNSGFHVILLQVQSDSGIIDVSYCRREGGRTTAEAPVDTELYNLTFAVSGKEITETDIYGWLPDCCTEFDAWVEEKGALAAHGEYLVSAGKVPVCPVHVELTPTGTAQIELVPGFAPECNPRTLQDPGTPDNDLWLFRATAPGLLTVRRSLCYEDGYMENGKTEDQITVGHYEVSDTLMIRPLDIMNGDISDDGMLNVADVVGITEFLCGQLQLTEEQMIRADYNFDNRVNAIDKTLMKRDILNGSGQTQQPAA